MTTVADSAAAGWLSGTNAMTIETKTTKVRKRLRNIPTLTQTIRPPRLGLRQSTGMTSIWLDEIAPDLHPSLDEDTSADVAIVGAGIAGVATAYHVSRSGAKVVVLEARTVAEAASGRNAGFLLAGVAENFVAAARRYGEDRALRIWRFTRHNQELVRAIVERERIACDLAWNGSAQIAGDDDEWAEVRESAERLKKQAVRVRLVPEDRSAIYEEDGELHPVRYVRGLAGAVVAAGARIHDG